MAKPQNRIQQVTEAGADSTEQALTAALAENARLRADLEQIQVEKGLQTLIVREFLAAEQDTVYNIVLQLVLDSLQASFGFFGYLNEQGELVCAACIPGDQRQEVDKPVFIFPPNQWGGIWATALQQKTVVLQNDGLSLPVGHLHLFNALAAPILQHEESIGVLCLGNKKQGFSNADRGLLVAICASIAPLLQSRLDAQLREKRCFKATSALVRSEAGLREAERLAHLGHWQLDHRTEKFFWSEGVFRIFQQDPALFSGKIDDFLALVHPDDRQRVQQVFSASVASREMYEVTHRLLLADGTVKFVHERCETSYDVRGNPVVSMGTVQDITERVATEEERKRLVTAIDQLNDIVVIYDLKGNIVYVNPALHHQTGYLASSVRKKNSRVAEFCDHPAAFAPWIWSILEKGQVWRGRCHSRKKNGEIFVADASISPVRNSNGAITHFVAVLQDVTRMLELEKQVQHAVKMEAVGVLAAGIAHDFNNILSAVMGYTRMAMEDLPRDSQPCRDLEQALLSGERAVDLVRQILLFGRPDASGLESVQLSCLVKEFAKMLRAAMPATIRIDLDVDPDCPPVRADTGQIHQVLMNLAANARQAMADGGVLTVTLKKSASLLQMGEYDGCNLDPGPGVALIVGDTGVGIDAKEQARIFDPFYTTRPHGEGSGLGLAVVHGIVQGHGGSILVRSEKNKGTVFTVLLPGIATMETPQGEPGAVSRQAAGAAEYLGAAEHLLVVDDEPHICIVLQRMLTMLGYRVSVFHHGREALEALSAAPECFDLLLTDLTMPVMNGWQLAERAKTVRADLPVILCTGYNDTASEAQVQERGIGALLLKPVSKEVLTQTIRKVLDERKNSGS